MASWMAEAPRDGETAQKEPGSRAPCRPDGRSRLPEDGGTPRLRPHRGRLENAWQTAPCGKWHALELCGSLSRGHAPSPRGFWSVGQLLGDGTIRQSGPTHRRPARSKKGAAHPRTVGLSLTGDETMGILNERCRAGGEAGEADISAKSSPSRQGPRVSPANVNSSGAGGVKSASRKGSQTVGGLVRMRALRLKNRADFSRVFKQGRTFGDRYLVLFVLSGADLPPMVGFTAERKAGTAVRRNRIKRRLRALHTTLVDDLVPCGHIIWLGKRSVLAADWDVLRRSARRLLKKAGCLETGGRG
jgi:ribonuclease P protein component